MHSKSKGNIGQFYAAAKLAELEFAVFTEEGDNSKVDIIGVKDNIILRFQVKAVTPKNNTLALMLKKSGPNYKFKYKEEMFDYFIVVDLISFKVYAVSSEVLRTHQDTFTIRLVAAKNKQSCNTNEADDYLMEKVLGH
jgi:hypothetical protein